VGHRGFFKDDKQMFYLGKEQSNIFDAAVASYSLVMIRYLLLVYILNKNNLISPIGPLFRDIADSYLQLQVAEKIWNAIKEHMLTSSELICHEIEPNIILHLLDIIEYAIVSQIPQIPAKL